MVRTLDPARRHLEGREGQVIGFDWDIPILKVPFGRAERDVPAVPLHGVALPRQVVFHHPAQVPARGEGRYPGRRLAPQLRDPPAKPRQVAHLLHRNLAEQLPHPGAVLLPPREVRPCRPRSPR